MATGIKKLRKILLGRETTAGTNAAATTYWRGTGTISDDIDVQVIEEDIGFLSGVDRTAVPSVGATLELDETPATFEQVLHLFEAGIHTATTATTGGGIQYPYVFATNAVTTPKTYSIEGGDNIQAEEFSYGYVEKFGLSGEAGGVVNMTATWKGRQVATTTFTTNPTLPSVEEIIFNKAKLYIDTAGGSVGGTQKTETFRGFDLSVDTGYRAKQTGDGSLYFTFVKNVGPEITCDITFEHDATAVAEIAAWRAETPRQIRLKFEGGALTTTGTTYTVKTLIIDLAGIWTKFPGLEDSDGNDIVTGTFTAKYDASATLFAEIIDVCDLTAVP